jgi:hypothetical protein
MHQLLFLAFLSVSELRFEHGKILEMVEQVVVVFVAEGQQSCRFGDADKPLHTPKNCNWNYVQDAEKNCGDYELICAQGFFFVRTVTTFANFTIQVSIWPASCNLTEAVAMAPCTASTMSLSTTVASRFCTRAAMATQTDFRMRTIAHRNAFHGIAKEKNSTLYVLVFSVHQNQSALAVSASSQQQCRVSVLHLNMFRRCEKVFIILKEP